MNRLIFLVRKHGKAVAKDVEQTFESPKAWWFKSCRLLLCPFVTVKGSATMPPTDPPWILGQGNIPLAEWLSS